MIRAATVTTVVLLALAAMQGRAEADWSYRTGHESHCSEHVIVIGRCGRLGAGWQPPMLRLELDAMVHHTTIDAMVGEDELGNPTGRLLQGGRVVGSGFGGRVIAGYHGWYFPMDIAVTGIERAPAVTPIAQLAPLPDAAPTTTGLMILMRMGFGKEVRLGRLMFGGEIGLGIGFISIGANLTSNGQPYVTDPRLLLDARAHAGVWLTQHISLSGYASTSLFREGERTFGLAMGFALFPWDGVRSN